MRRTGLRTLLAIGVMVVMLATAAYARSSNVSTIACTGGSCYGTSKADTLSESSGDDQIYGVAGNDQVDGSLYSGDTDVLSGGDDSDYANGGDFDTLDTVSGDGGTNDTCVISQNVVTGEEDTLGGGCETVKVFSYEFTGGSYYTATGDWWLINCTGGSCYGTSGDDTLTGSDYHDDQIYGMAGNDQISDWYEAGAGPGDTDVLSGGDGSDTVDGGDWDTLDTVSGDGGTNDTCVITENVDTGASDTLGGGCETVKVYQYVPDPPPPDGSGDVQGWRCWC